MSKRDLKKYLSDLSKSQLEEQFVEMYDKFKDVKVYYDFVFNPNEKNLINFHVFELVVHLDKLLFELRFS